MKALSKKLLEVQKQVGAITKDKVNPHFKSKFADINNFVEEVKPVLSDNGLILLQPLTTLHNEVDGTNSPAIKTIIVGAETGETYEDIFPLPALADPQKQVAAITYFRRAALQSMLFLQAEDDDGTTASTPTKPATKPAPKPKVDPIVAAKDMITKATTIGELEKIGERISVSTVLNEGQKIALEEFINDRITELS